MRKYQTELVSNQNLMAKLYAPVKFLASDKQSFVSDDGENVEYYVNAVRAEGGILELNSKADYSACEGQEGIAEIEASGENKRFKLTLKKFYADAVIELPDAEIE